jgi:hypothetical protein
VASVIRRLWEDQGVKDCFARRSRLQIPDSVGYFLDELVRITQDDYLPTHQVIRIFTMFNHHNIYQDILMSRKESTGVVEHSFTMDDKTLTFVDVAGQRNKRKKWINHFDGVVAVIFLVAVSEYDQVRDSLGQLHPGKPKG